MIFNEILRTLTFNTYSQQNYQLNYKQLVKTISVGLLLYSVHNLTEGNDERRAFFSSLAAVLCLIISPVYHYHQTNEKLKFYLKKLLNWLKNAFIFLIIKPIIWLFEWIKYLFLLRWLPSKKIINLIKSTFQLIFNYSLILISKITINLILPIFSMILNKLNILLFLIYFNSIYPLILIFYSIYKKIEDFIFINYLGPLFQKILNKLPQKNILDTNSEHEYDEFLPSSNFQQEEEEEEENEIINNKQINNNKELLEDLIFDDEEEANSLLFFGLQQINISESDSDTDAFLPSSFIIKRKEKNN
ncbi:hypothetical protein Mgra_00000862 [Meloidogyne graminicola]|uniref:Transmembrane protein n=1 Tax=Meloidogyne graminicola TaxID=189291 RepID=A0A8T0A3K9_9BILA|nr:hypothetical protein Mgra_00000862 [Meloidogyne graminicola]